MKTVKEWLETLSQTDSSTVIDNFKMKNLLRRIGFPHAEVVVGIVYLRGYGRPISIHSVARELLETLQEEESTDASIPETS